MKALSQILYLLSYDMTPIGDIAQIWHNFQYHPIYMVYVTALWVKCQKIILSQSTKAYTVQRVTKI